MSKAVKQIASAQEQLAAQGARHIGDLVTWNFADVDVDRGTVRAIFDAEGFSGMVPNLDPESALSRAAGEVREPASLFVARFAKPNKDSPVAFGVYVRKAVAGESGDDHACGARVRVDPNSGLVVALPPENGVGDGDALEHAAAIASKANHLLTYARAKDLGSAQVTVLKALGGIPFRDKGGVYLLPPAACERWARIATGLEKCGVSPVRVEMHDAPSNVAAASGAAKSALEGELMELRADLEKASAEGMRDSSMKSRVASCDALMARAELFRNVLRNSADGIEQKILAVKSRFRRALAGDLDAFDLKDLDADSGPCPPAEEPTEAPPPASEVPGKRRDPFTIDD